MDPDEGLQLNLHPLLRVFFVGGFAPAPMGMSPFRDHEARNPAGLHP